MKREIDVLVNFITLLETKSKGIRIKKEIGPSMLKFIKGDKKLNSYLDTLAEGIKDEFKILLTEEQKLVLLLNAQVSWWRPEQAPREGRLGGGFCFNGFVDILSSDPTYLEPILKDFLAYEPAGKTDAALIKKLRFIESISNPRQGADARQFGCVTLEKGKFPTCFYYYDDGLVYLLPFKSYEDYIEAMVSNAAVQYWQYFYIEPQIVVDKNHGLKYITSAMNLSSHLANGIDDFTYKPSIKFDRLDLINEYLGRCVRLLPGSFPFMDFSRQKEYYEKFKKLYLAIKK
jgi:hypothetical protein